MTVSYPWQLLKTAQSFSTSDEYKRYYCAARTELVELFIRTPVRVLDIGCAGGGTGAEIKRRYPQAHVTGIELNRDAAALARERIDRVIEKSVEGIDYAAEGIARGSIDTVLFPDVLEHLYDPWNVLVALKPYLTPDAQVVSSIPNIRNFGFIQDLVAGPICVSSPCTKP
jgi:2-polyprenyl-3-methyl-5-hydroxy-6-metoxy-1,4-benzoquinol methylase